MWPAHHPRPANLRPSRRSATGDRGTVKLVLFGSSLVSAYWNGAATYYRGICKAMHARGHEIVFVEPDIYERQTHRDLVDDPPYATVRVCQNWRHLAGALPRAPGAHLLPTCSGLGA